MSPWSSMWSGRNPSSLLLLIKAWACFGGQRESSSSSWRITRLTSRNWSSESRIWKFCGRPASSQCIRNRRWAMPWKVPTHMEPLGACNRVSMRWRISAAALLVKVTARILWGDKCCSWINQAMRCTSTRVLPLPAPANTSRRSAPEVTACAWALLRDWTNEEFCIAAFYCIWSSKCQT